MTDIKYVAFDVHQATIPAAALNLSGKLITRAVFHTEPSAIRDFLRGLSGTLGSVDILSFSVTRYLVR
jgi:hypothetical protein